MSEFDDSDDLDELLIDKEKPPQNISVVKRITKDGKVVTDFKKVITKVFSGGYPETTDENIYTKVLDCGHYPDTRQQIFFGGYCTGKIGWFGNKACDKEYCTKCEYQCPNCGRHVSVQCCAVIFDYILVCRRCRRNLRFKKYFMFFINPLISEDSELEKLKLMEKYKARDNHEKIKEEYYR